MPAKPGSASRAHGFVDDPKKGLSMARAVDDLPRGRLASGPGGLCVGGERSTEVILATLFSAFGRD
jgi:hypothetical protein